MVKSILQRNKACYICGTTLNLHYHHIFYGTANRKISDIDRCACYLCVEHHTGIRGVHHNRTLDTQLKKVCELAYLKEYKATKEDFIKRYGKNYL